MTCQLEEKLLFKQCNDGMLITTHINKQANKKSPLAGQGGRTFPVQNTCYIYSLANKELSEMLDSDLPEHLGT